MSSTYSIPRSPDAFTLPPGMDDRDLQPKLTRSPPTLSNKGLMLPPPLPVTVIAAPPPPRMTRLPSLKQLSDRLHSSPSATHVRIETSQPVTPPKLNVTINTANPSPFAQSPSSRLRLPPSAMKRTLSATSNVTTTSTPVSLCSFPQARDRIGINPGDVFTNSDPFATDSSRAASMSRQSSREGARKLAGPTVLIDEVIGVSGKVEAPRNSTATRLLEGGKVHPLRHAWTLHFDSKSYKPDPISSTSKEGATPLGDYEKSLVTIGKFDTIEGFARHLNNIRLPSQLAHNSNYHLFKDGILPMWEDPANAEGGKWVVLFRSSAPLLDASWANLTMALVGEVLDPYDQVCGIVVSSRPKVDRIQVWTRGKDDADQINGIGQSIIEALGLDGRFADAMSMEFQFNASNTNPPPNKYMHIPFPPPRGGSFSHAPPTPSRPSGFTLSPIPAGSRPDRLGPGGRSSQPISPTIPKGHGDMLQPPPVIRRTGSSQAINAFTGPMGMGSGQGRGSLSGSSAVRTESWQGVLTPAGTGP
ncbi:MAG: hypothetical protein TREMPRED_000698 [Tremellales sp. Tagirdzhanova-0007]|nr:MAG: hypothetical protein TREMPRED_000698 [Tremellales sp. Tagirdzhanova-0007]